MHRVLGLGGSLDPPASSLGHTLISQPCTYTPAFRAAGAKASTEGLV